MTDGKSKKRAVKYGEFRSLARAHTTTAIKVLSAIMNDKTAADAARIAAATALMDRGWGKPKQEVMLEQEVTVNLVNSLQRIAQLEHSSKIIDHDPEGDGRNATLMKPPTPPGERPGLMEKAGLMSHRKFFEIFGKASYYLPLFIFPCLCP